LRLLDDKIDNYKTYLNQLYEKKENIISVLDKKQIDNDESILENIHDEYFSIKKKRSIKGSYY
jgi:hypothetical protein